MTYVNDQDYCPKHNTEAKKTYDFGKCRDAEVTVYNGCNCATCFVNNGFNDPGTYHTSYTEASGRAKMIVAQARVW